MMDTEHCIGCQVCVEICPAHAIAFCRDSWGEGKAMADANKCVKCGLCDRICPGTHADINEIPETVNAVVSEKHRDTGSSGGVFFEIAGRFIRNGGVVYGAAFNKDLKLVHQRAATREELIPLCKSKYLHSDMSGVYKSVREDLKNGKRVLFVGAPCQASAVKNLFSKQYGERLYIADFLCRGTGTQRVFDACIREEEKKCDGKITDFRFRAKSRNAEHSFSYTLDRGKKQRTVSGYGFEFPYYYSFLKYTVFNDACYSCPYAKSARVGDITLGDFWGIQRYNSLLDDREGVSMLAVNSEKGKQLFAFAQDSCKVYPYALSIATKHNQSYNKPIPYPTKKRELVEILEEKGEAALVRAMACPNIIKNLAWARMPTVLKKMYQKLRGRV
jgi:coenzyme F420-reducing hydrogenase beta subunit